jgi:hypothetical protein
MKQLLSQWKRRLADSSFAAVDRLRFQFLSDREKQLVYDLRADVARLAPLPASATTPESQFWGHFSELIGTHIANANPDRFLTWQPIINTMFVWNENYIATEYAYLQNRPDWLSRWRPAIRENPFGRPRPYPADPTTSENLIHHAHHLAAFEEIIGVPVDALEFVCEFGGGYGSMCRLFHNLNFKGKYVIFDLPILSCLQRYYLKAIGLRAAADAAFGASDDIACIHDAAAWNSALTPAASNAKSLFISTWAISETPIDYRPTVLKNLGAFNQFLFAFQEKFQSADNLEYFSALMKSMSDVQWTMVPIRHLPGHRYLFGRR